MSQQQSRTPEFIVWYHNRGMDLGRYYAYRALTTQNKNAISVNGLHWLACRYIEEAQTFNSISDANDAQMFFRIKFAKNTLTDYGIERVDLYDGILDDIDNLSTM